MQGGKVNLSLTEGEIETAQEPELEKPKKESFKDTTKVSKIKRIRTPKKDSLGPSRFLGEGISFKAKLIGVEEIDDARGDKLCQEALSRLKQVVKTSGTHKQRICLTISLSGVKLKEDKTGVVMYHHPVHHISFISQDVVDDRAFGYICSPTPKSFHFVAIKTEKAASQVVITLRDLFQTVLDMKKQQKEQDTNETIDLDSSGCTDPGNNLEEESARNFEKDEEHVYEDISSFVKAPEEPDSPPGDPLLLDFDANLAQLQQGIAQMNFSLATSASQQPLLSSPQLDTADPIENLPIDDSSPSTSTSPAMPLNEPEPINLVDRYKVFEDLDSVPSIFENPSAIIPEFLPKPITTPPPEAEPVDEVEEDDAFNPLPPSSKDAKSDLLSIFAELDPLGKDRPFVDKKNFFHAIKNPPKKVLKDLMGTSFDSNASSQSPPTSGVSFDMPPAVIVSHSNPFSEPSNLARMSPPPPRVPPRIPFPTIPPPFPIPEHASFNPFNIESLPPNTPPPILLSSRASDPTFAVMPSPPPNTALRKCVTPTPPLPKRKTNREQQPWPHSYQIARPPLHIQHSLASPPIPIPSKRPPLSTRASSICGNESPIALRRIQRLSVGSEGRVSPPSNWDVFEDPLEAVGTSPLSHTRDPLGKTFNSSLGADPFMSQTMRFESRSETKPESQKFESLGTNGESQPCGEESWEAPPFTKPTTFLFQETFEEEMTSTDLTVEALAKNSAPNPFQSEKEREILEEIDHRHLFSDKFSPDSFVPNDETVSTPESFLEGNEKVVSNENVDEKMKKLEPPNTLVDKVLTDPDTLEEVEKFSIANYVDLDRLETFPETADPFIVPDYLSPTAISPRLSPLKSKTATIESEISPAIETEKLELPSSNGKMVEPPSIEVKSPDESSIFRKKQDPFADDFFLSLAKK